MRRYREERREAIRQYVGNHWSEEGTREKVPVNLIALYVSVVGRALIAKNPRVMLSTFDRAHKPVISAMQAWINQEIEDIRLEQSLSRCVLDGLFTLGIMKVALATPGDAAIEGFKIAAGAPFAEAIDFDDFVFDVHARDLREVSYVGHRYRVPLDVIKDSKLYSKYRKDLAPSFDSPYNLEGDERASALGRGFYAGNLEEFEDHVDVWEIYLPRHKQVLTLADDQLVGATTMGTGSVGDALRVQRWIGPDSGPYHYAAPGGIVPSNAMPKGPIQDLVDMHEFSNRVYRKLMRQAERQKEILAVQGGALEDGSRIMEANDGEIVRVDNPEKSQARVFGAPNQQNYAMFLGSKDMFSWLAGNLEIMGGLGAQSRTATQDSMLNQNSSRGLDDMQQRTINFTAEVLKALCWYYHHDPYRVMKSNHAVPGLPGMTFPRQVTPQQRQKVPWSDLKIQVDPYSMQHQTPQSRLQTLNGIVAQVMPMMGLLQQQGISLDMNAYLEKVANYADMPDLPEILTMQEPPDAEQSSGGSTGSTMASNTTRNYVRQSMPGRTQQGNDMNLQSQLMGVNPGGSQQTQGGAA